VAAALILLSVVPVTAGAMRVAGLAGGAAMTRDNARFYAAPVPVVVHIISASLYCLLCPFQFVPGFRRRRPGWHRAAGLDRGTWHFMAGQPYLFRIVSGLRAPKNPVPGSTWPARSWRPARS
jgi:hypothetical protein